MAFGARSGCLVRRRYLRLPSSRRNLAVGVSNPPVRHFGDRTALGRQPRFGPIGRGVQRESQVGVLVQRGPASGGEGHGVCGKPGGGPVVQRGKRSLTGFQVRTPTTLKWVIGSGGTVLDPHVNGSRPIHIEPPKQSSRCRDLETGCVHSIAKAAAKGRTPRRLHYSVMDLRHPPHVRCPPPGGVNRRLDSDPGRTSRGALRCTT